MRVIDQMQRVVELDALPQRIISLVPSQTEYLFDLGLQQQIVGLTRYCIHPADRVSQVKQIGGTKLFDLAAIHALQPDLIIGNKEENYEQGIAQLATQYPVWMSDIATLDDAYDMMQQLGIITGREQQADDILTAIRAQFAAYHYPRPATHSCAYFIWRKPYMGVGSGTFIHAMLECAGYRNVLADMDRYPELSPERLGELAPDYIFLSSEPYAFGEKHFDEFKAMSPNSKVILVDGEIFSWYGSRLRYAPAYWEGMRV
jgi:ABC-type Fe3+-hydroxamate transport system substrate-binding protein